VLPKAPKEEYSRADVLRQFGLSERQLRGWERLDLIPPAATYTFSDLIAIQTIVKLRESRIQPKQIGRALASLRRKLAVEQPLSELRIVSDGRKIEVRIAGQRMEAISGQILLDFDTATLGGVAAFPGRKPAAGRVHDAETWFQQGLDLEEAGAPVEEAIEAYQKALELNPGAAGALVNLGTIYYRQRNFIDAETYYREAIEADPSYPLAQFNIGNLYDELGRIEDAEGHYKMALELNPQYADAHFNLALLCERQGDNLRAVYHWKSYLKLDSGGEWAEVARRQLERLRQATLVHSRT
jgi:tetratricopeptide (TPR) repeat protein